MRVEISAVGDVESLTRDDLRNLKYLQNVLKEGMMPRCYVPKCWAALLSTAANNA